MATSARETFANRTADHTARIAKLRLTGPQKRDLHHIANGTNQNVTRAMAKRLEALGLVTVPPITVQQLADGTWPGTRLTDLGTAYVRTVKA